MSSFKGMAVGVDKPFLGVITTRLPWRARSKPYIYVLQDAGTSVSGRFRALRARHLKAVLAGEGLKTPPLDGLPAVTNLPAEALAALEDGDVVLIEPDGRVMVAYKAGSPHNCLLVTNRCNCLCLMCPQPPGEDPPGLWEQNLALVSLLNPQKTAGLAITGGEPTLLGEKLLDLLRLLRGRLPHTQITLLTNGRRLKNLDYARELVRAGHPRLLMEIPLMAATDTEHDYIMGAPGSFWDTLAGLHNLARLHQAVGLRVVLHALTVPHLARMVEFIYRNLPFVVHVAFMGMETTGLAEKNLDLLWIDPYDYREELAFAVRHLARRLIPVSVYNHPLCLLAPEIRPFARPSITSWKVYYPPLCEDCGQRSKCGGLFGTGVRQSAYLTPLP